MAIFRLFEMNLRKNVIFQHSLVTLLVVVAISIALGVTLARQITDYQIRSHVHLYPDRASGGQERSLHIYVS